MILTDRTLIESYSKSGQWGEITLLSLFYSLAERSPDRLALADPPNREQIAGGPPRRLTFAEVTTAIRNLSQVFRSLNLEPDDVIAFQLPNTVEQVVVLLAAWECGLIATPLPLLWREYELNSALPLVAPKALITCSKISGRDHGALMCATAAGNMSIRAVLAFGDDANDGVIGLDSIFESADEDATGGASAHQVGANDVATICWVGGETDTPCPVPRSHNQWIAAGMMMLLEADIDNKSVLLCAYPLSGLVPIGVFFVPWLMSGGTLHLHHPFDVAVYSEQMRNEGVTFAGLPPAVIDALKAKGAFDEGGVAEALPGLACIWPGPLLPKDAEDRAADLMTKVIDVRALGEMVYVARRRVAGETPGLLPHGDLTYPSSQTNGAVLLQTRVKGGISNNRQAASLLSGDLLIRSPMMFDSYFPAQAEGTDEPLVAKDPQGYVNTGFRCILQGQTVPKIEIVRRNTNVIFHGGLSVSAQELDRLYGEYEGVLDAAAFAFDDPVMGERIMAAIVPEPGMTIALEEFVEYLRNRQVAPYKLPDRLVTVREIPRDGEGVVLRDKMLQHL